MPTQTVQQTSIRLCTSEYRCVNYRYAKRFTCLYPRDTRLEVLICCRNGKFRRSDGAVSLITLYLKVYMCVIFTVASLELYTNKCPSTTQQPPWTHGIHSIPSGPWHGDESCRS